MKQDKITKIVPYIGTLAAILIVGGLVSAQTYGGWTDAPANPPSGNVAAPINAGPVAQTKEGNLQLNGSLGVSGSSIFADTVNSNKSNGGYNFIVNQVGKGAYGLAVNMNTGGFAIDDVGNGSGQTLLHLSNSILGGTMSLGTTAPSAGLKLDVEGKVGAEAYCDKNGENCYTTAQMAATTGGGAVDLSGYQKIDSTGNGAKLGCLGPNFSIKTINANGTVTCEADDIGTTGSAPVLSVVDSPKAYGSTGQPESFAVSVCPANTVVVGGGGYCENGLMTESYGDHNNNTWSVKCGRYTTQDGGQTSNTRAVSWGRCIRLN